MQNESDDSFAFVGLVILVRLFVFRLPHTLDRILLDEITQGWAFKWRQFRLEIRLWRAAAAAWAFECGRQIEDSEGKKLVKCKEEEELNTIC